MVRRRVTGPYERRAFPLTLRSDGGAPTRIIGHAAVFNSDSEEMGWFSPFKERISPGAFDGALERVRSGLDTVYALFNHDENYIIASTADRTLELSTDSIGLVASMEPMDTQTIRDLVVTPMRQGKLRKMSFGFTVSDEHPEKINGQDYRIIDRVGQLFDVSPVTFPAYPATDVQARVRQMLINGPSPELVVALANIDLLADGLDEAIDTLLDDLGIPDEDEIGEPEEMSAKDHMARIARRLPILRKLSVAGRKAAPVAVAPLALAGAMSARLRDLELRDRDLQFSQRRMT